MPTLLHLRLAASAAVLLSALPAAAQLACAPANARGEPLLLSSHGHGMVVVGIRYDLHTASGAVRITGGTVIDPLPGAGVRPLQLPELQVSLLARVDLRQLRRAPTGFVSARELALQHRDAQSHDLLHGGGEATDDPFSAR